MENKRFLVLNNYSKVTILSGFIAALPLIVIPFYPKDIIYVKDFLISSGICFLVALAFLIFGKPYIPSKFYTVTQRRSTMFVLYAWVFNFFIGALPFVTGGQLPFLRALFEAVSSFTTCGL